MSAENKTTDATKSGKSEEVYQYAGQLTISSEKEKTRQLSDNSNSIRMDSQKDVDLLPKFGKYSTDHAQSEPKKSFINFPLIPVKIILFAWYAAGACLLPYMTLHMKQLGLTMVEMTAVYAILPLIQLFGSPIAGFVADKTGNYKSVLIMTLSTCIVTTLLIQYVVPARKAKDPQAATVDDDTNDALYEVTFLLYLVIRVFHQFAVGLTYVLLDATAIELAKQNNSHYGRQRFWAILATGVFSPICGYIIDHVSHSVDEYGTKINNYDPAFYFFNILTAFTLVKASLIDLRVEPPPKDAWSKIKPLLKSANVWIFLFSVFIMGSCWGFLESFLFIHLQKLDAPNHLMGLTVTMGAFVGLPFLYESKWFVKKIGGVQLLLLALVVYFVRLMGYSLLTDPWWCIPYELMEAFTLHLMWVATVEMANVISPKGMPATLQGVVGALNFGVGRGFGSLVGGAVIVLFGIRAAFRVIGCMALTTAILYAVLHFFFLPPLEIHDEKSKTNNKSNNDSIRSSKRRRQTAKDIEASGAEVTAAAS